MTNLMRTASDVLGAAGALVCAACVIARLAGVFYVLDVEVMTVFQAAVGMVVIACFGKLWVLERRSGV